jgi:hypothetical protein
MSYQHSTCISGQPKYIQHGTTVPWLGAFCTGKEEEETNSVRKMWFHMTESHGRKLLRQSIILKLLTLSPNHYTANQYSKLSGKSNWLMYFVHPCATANYMSGQKK